MGPPRLLTSRPKAVLWVSPASLYMNQDCLLTHLETTAAITTTGHHAHASYLGFLTAALFYRSGNHSEMGRTSPTFSELSKKHQDSTVGFPESKGKILSTVSRSWHKGPDF